MQFSMLAKMAKSAGARYGSYARDRTLRGAADLSSIKFNRAKDTNNPEMLRRNVA